MTSCLLRVRVHSSMIGLSAGPGAPSETRILGQFGAAHRLQHRQPHRLLRGVGEDVVVGTAAGARVDRAQHGLAHLVAAPRHCAPHRSYFELYGGFRLRRVRGGPAHGLAVTRCLEIFSEASRRLPDDLKARLPSIAWGIWPAQATSIATTMRTWPRSTCGTRCKSTCHRCAQRSRRSLLRSIRRRHDRRATADQRCVIRRAMLRPRIKHSVVSSTDIAQ